MIDELELNFQKNNYMTCWGNGQIRLFDQGRYPILEYDIYTEVDARRMVDEVSIYILNQVLPEWEAKPTLEFLEQKVNGYLTDAPNFSGVVLAKLVGNSDYENISKHYTVKSKNWAEREKQDLEKVVDFLDKRTKEELEVISK